MPNSSQFEHALALDAQVEALNAQRAALDAREQRLDAREARLDQREAQLVNLLGSMTSWDRAVEKNTNGQMDAARQEHGAKKPESLEEADPVQNVSKLLGLYRLSGGVVPPRLLVAEVEALKQAATYYQDLAASLDVQIHELEERCKLSTIQKVWIETTKSYIDTKTKTRDKALESMKERLDSYTRLRGAGIQRLMPNLLKTAQHSDSVFEEAVCQEENGEASLRHIGELCWRVTTKGKALRQPLPAALPKTSLHTLLLLLEMATHSAPRLQRLMERAVHGRVGCKVLAPPEPTKGIARALEKVQTEYDGDYTRLLDYSRTTIVCDTLLVFAEVLAWLCDDAAPTFTVCRIKDRISRESGYDAETSGGNRDVLLNGWLDMGMGKRFLVEVQVHLRSMFVLKADLHVLYDGARALGSMDPAVTSHEGVLSESIIERMQQGVLREVRCPFSSATNSQVERLAESIQTEPNALRVLSLGYLTLQGSSDKPAIGGWTLQRLLVHPTGTVACTRLKLLELAANNLCGAIPDALALCRSITSVNLNYNSLEGPIPEWLAEMPYLHEFRANGNLLSGAVDVISRWSALKIVCLIDNRLEGGFTTNCLTRLARLHVFNFGSLDAQAILNKSPLIQKHYDAIKDKPGFRNSRLRMTAEQRSELCRLWAEETRLDVGRSRKQFSPFMDLWNELTSRSDELDLDVMGTLPALQS